MPEDGASRRALIWSWAQALIVGAMLLAGGLFYFSVQEYHFPVQHWLLWRYLWYWFWALTFVAACLSSGHLVLRYVAGRRLPLYEHIIAAFALGVLLFGLTVMLCGLFFGFGPRTFHRIAFLLVMSGAWAITIDLERDLPHLRRLWTKPSLPHRWRWLLIAFGVGGLALLYFWILSPTNIQADARWKHLALAEQYVVHGRVFRARDGWAFAARPHFSTHLYTWAMLAPTPFLFDRIELALHIEFVVVVMTTIFGIPALVRRLVPNADPGIVWPARFLFPGVMLYDSGLGAGADHIAALFSVTIFVFLSRSARGPKLDLRWVGLLAAMLSAALMIKYSFAILTFPAVILTLAVIWVSLLVDVVRGRADDGARLRLLLAPLLAIGLGLVLSSPHWLKNLVFYGNPIYPVGHSIFGGHPWHPTATYDYTWGYRDLKFWPASPGYEGWRDTFRALFNFSFVAHDWPRFHGVRPVFGSLFTLLLAPLVLMKGSRRVWPLIIAIHVALAVWFQVHHQDRYLQAILPWMTAATAAAIILLWRTRARFIRVPLVALIIFQVLSGADVYFLATFKKGGEESPLIRVINMISEARERSAEKNPYRRLEIERRWRDLGNQFPRKAVILRHDVRVSLGLGRRTVSDWSPYALGLSYEGLTKPSEVWDMLRANRVTHIVWGRSKTSKSFRSLGADIMFFEFAYFHAKNYKLHGPAYVAAKMPRRRDRPKDEGWDDRVVILGCGTADEYETGMYRIGDLTTPSYGPDMRAFPEPRQAMTLEEALEAVNGVNFVVIQPECKKVNSAIRREFRFVGRRAKIDIPRRPWEKRKKLAWRKKAVEADWNGFDRPEKPTRGKLDDLTNVPLYRIWIRKPKFRGPEHVAKRYVKAAKTAAREEKKRQKALEEGDTDGETDGETGDVFEESETGDFDEDTEGLIEGDEDGEFGDLDEDQLEEDPDGEQIEDEDDEDPTGAGSARPPTRPIRGRSIRPHK